MSEDNNLFKEVFKIKIMVITNELLYYLNRFNFNELNGRGYSPIEKEGCPLLWIENNKIILPKMKISSMKDLIESPKESFFPSSVKEINTCLQKRMFINYFTSIDKREDVFCNFKGFLGFNFNGEEKYYNFFINSPQQIENLTLSSFVGVKTISRPEKGVFLFESDWCSSVPEIDSKLATIEKYILGLKGVMDTQMYRRIMESKGIVSRYHPQSQQLEFMKFIKHLSVASAEKALDAYGGDFFGNYVRSVH